MANQHIRNICEELHSKIAQNVSPDLVMDHLLSKKVISSDDYGRLRQVPFTRDRCRDLMSLLYGSSHPQAFIYLRLALLDEYSWIVDEIDEQIPSLTSQLQQLKLSQASNGKLSSYEYTGCSRKKRTKFAHNKFSTIRRKIKFFAPKCSAKITVYQSTQNLCKSFTYSLLKYQSNHTPPVKSPACKVVNIAHGGLPVFHKCLLTSFSGQSLHLTHLI